MSEIKAVQFLGDSKPLLDVLPDLDYHNVTLGGNFEFSLDSVPYFVTKDGWLVKSQVGNDVEYAAYPNDVYRMLYEGTDQPNFDYPDLFEDSELSDDELVTPIPINDTVQVGLGSVVWWCPNPGSQLIAVTTSVTLTYCSVTYDLAIPRDGILVGKWVGGTFKLAREVHPDYLVLGTGDTISGTSSSFYDELEYDEFGDSDEMMEANINYQTVSRVPADSLTLVTREQETVKEEKKPPVLKRVK